MAYRAIYPDREIAGFRAYGVIVVDDNDQFGAGLLSSGYFTEIKDVEPEEERDAPEGPPGA